MANTKISELPTGTLNTSDDVVGNQGGTSKVMLIGANVDAASGDKLLGASANGDVKQLTPKMAMIDDYSTGTWEPEIEGDTVAGTNTYAVQGGSYVAIGNLIFVDFYLRASSVTSTGTLNISGLPFTVHNNFRATNAFLPSRIKWIFSNGKPINNRDNKA